MNINPVLYRAGEVTHQVQPEDMQKKKLYKGKGPIELPVRSVTIKTDAKGDWITNKFDLRNHGWSEEFRIIATSVEGKNSTYVIVKDDARPIVE